MRRFRRWLRRLRRRATFLAMRQLMRTTGFASARRIGQLLADLQFRLSWRVRRRCARDLALLLGRPPGDPAVRELLRQAYRVNTIAVLEVLAMFDRRLDDGVLDAQSEVEGLERLRAAFDGGRGAILLGAHMGNGALLTARLARAGWPVSVVFRQARMMSAGFFEQGLALYGIEAIPANAGLRAYVQMLDALKRGRILFVIMDQGTKATQDGITMRFLGKEMPMSAGPAQLARQSGAPVLPLLTTAAEPVWKFTIGAPVARIPGAPLESEAAELACLTEQNILRHPELWSWHHRRWRKFPMAALPQ
jgi:KDO2-lipid IV(A) lauroyltransferase